MEQKESPPAKLPKALLQENKDLSDKNLINNKNENNNRENINENNESITEKISSSFLNHYGTTSQKSISAPNSTNLQSPFIQRAKIDELENVLIIIFEEKEMIEQMETSDALRVAVGHINFSITLEKSKKLTNKDLKKQWDEAQDKLDKVLNENSSILRSKNAMYYLNLMRLHVSRHLNEIFLLIDNNSEKTPLYFDKIEKENINLKKEVSFLTGKIEDLKQEISVLRHNLNISGTHVPTDFNSQSTPINRLFPTQLPFNTNLIDFLDSRNDPIIEKFEEISSCLSYLKEKEEGIKMKWEGKEKKE